MPQSQPALILSRRSFLLGTTGLVAAGALGVWPAAADAAALQREVNAYIQSLRRVGRIRPDERTAWSVYDFTTGTKLVAINEDRPLQAASMIKPFVAQAYFYRHDDSRRRYPYDHDVRLRMTAMIRDSSNGATNYFMKRAGGGSPRGVERLLKHRAGGIFRQTRIVEYIPHSGRTYRNRASAHDYSRFLYALWKNRLPFADELRHYMGLPNGDRIQDGVSGMPQITDVYHKTGSTARLCGDMGIVVGRGRDGRRYPYTFIAIIEKSRRTRRYGPWIRDRGDVIREVSGLVYDFMKRRHNLI